MYKVRKDKCKFDFETLQVFKILYNYIKIIENKWMHPQILKVYMTKPLEKDS